MKTFPVKDLMVGDLVRWGPTGAWWLLIGKEAQIHEDFWFTWNNGIVRAKLHYGTNAHFEQSVSVMREGEEIFP